MPTKLAEESEMVIYRIVAFRYIYSRNKAGGTFQVPLIFLRLLPTRYESLDNKRIFQIAGLNFFRFPESNHAFGICCKEGLS